MRSAVSPEDDDTGDGERRTIEYSFTMNVKGLSQAEIDQFASGIEGWRIRPGTDDVHLYPQNEPVFDGSAGDYLHDTFSRHEKTFAAASRIGTSRRISLAIYFDADRIAAIAPVFDTAVIRRLADLDFSLEICVFPSSFEDDEGTEE